MTEIATICGLPYEVKNMERKGVKPRYVFPAVVTKGPRKGKASRHSGGKHIRFKSLAAAERHITNMKLGQ